MCGQDRDKTHVRNFSRQTERDQLGDLGINGRTILKKILDETGYYGVDLRHTAQDLLGLLWNTLTSHKGNSLRAGRHVPKLLTS